MKYTPLLVVMVVLTACLSCAAFADDIAFDNLKPGTTETTIFAGIGRNYHYPSSTKNTFQFDLVGIRVSHQRSPHTAIGYEFGTGLDILGDDNPTTWNTVSYQQYIRANKNEAITFDVSIGVMRFKEKVPELATRTNFTERLGFTYKWKKGPDTAWFLHATFSHMSNAGIKIPNIGINASHIAFGHSWYNLHW